MGRKKEIDYGHWDVSLVGEFDPDKHFGFVYRITRNDNGKSYIGCKHLFKYQKRKRIKASEWRYYDDAGYYVGCMVGQTIGWAAIMFGFCTRPPDPLHWGDEWRARWMERLEALPFLLGSVRAVSASQRTMIGGLIGISFYLLQQLSGHLAGILGLNPGLVILTPPLILLAIAIAAIRHKTP